VTEPVGVWILGALGGVATTMVVGARAMAHGLVSDAGLMTTRPELASLDLVPVGDLVFGGHEVRLGTYYDAAREIYAQSGSLRLEVVEALKDDLLDVSEALKPGTAVNSGPAIEELATNPVTRQPEHLKELVQQIQSDIRSFRARESIDQVVVVNLASTEPPLESDEGLRTLEELEAVIDRDDAARVRPSTLYAYAAMQEDCAYVNFTPSEAALVPAVRELAERRGLPYMGSDGKTGETLVKSALAPMFKYRNLRVLSWNGYNMLGDRDGRILAHEENLQSKVASKDSVLGRILGYPVHTKVGIDYVESLGDLKTAWDFIHFQGFLDYKMSMQFTWQGCDAILAAPLVLDIVRLTDLAVRRGEKGPMTHLAPFFKSPLGVDDQDLHTQFHAMMAYLVAAGAALER